MQRVEDMTDSKLEMCFDTYLPGLHLLGATPEGHIRVAGGGAIPFFLFDSGDECATFTTFPLVAPVFKHLLYQLVILLQQQLGLLQTNQLQHKI